MRSTQSRFPEIVREGVCLLGGAVAILMQIAHPKIALGLTTHSNFTHNVLGRMAATLTYIYVVLLGEAHEGEALAKMIKARHRKVSGSEGELSYAASDADLLVWVNATVYKSMVDAYEQAYGRMEEDMADYVLKRFGRLGTLLHEDRQVPLPWPESRESFDHYWEAMCKSCMIDQDNSKRLQRTLFDIQNHVPWPANIVFIIAMPFLRSIATLSLPENIRQGYDLKPTRLMRALNVIVGFLMRQVYPHLPSGVRQLPATYILYRARQRQQFGTQSCLLEGPYLKEPDASAWASYMCLAKL
ncbi:hypothetical protein N7513_003231 [Penicillium frequentans]|nr:hypothetical protein N7513_003231 [Penicillium glabrum]